LVYAASAAGRVFPVSSENIRGSEASSAVFSNTVVFLFCERGAEEIYVR